MDFLADTPAGLGISPHKILMIGPSHHTSRVSLDHHEVLTCKSLEKSLEIISQQRPDLVILFATKGKIPMEEYVMTWLIEGFRGKFIVFDPKNRLKDWEILMDSQVIDDYFPGPVSPVRFASIVKSQMTRDLRFASPRAMTTFDLFRNLFDRGLNALFFFNEELNQCVAANLKAEQMTGLDFRQLQKTSLEELIHPDYFDMTCKVIRRANRQYYDSKGASVLAPKHRPHYMVEFSCGVFKFGRKHFVKLEFQERSQVSQKTLNEKKKPENGVKNLLLQEELVQILKELENPSNGHSNHLNFLQISIGPGSQFHRVEDMDDETNQLFSKIQEFIEKKIRGQERIFKLGPDQLAVVFTESTSKEIQTISNRIDKAMAELSWIKKEKFIYDLKLKKFSEEVFHFMSFLRPASFFSTGKGSSLTRH